MTKQEFLQIYQEELKRVVIELPDKYAWPVENMPIVAAKMVDAMIAGTANLYSVAIRRTCKRIGIPHTRKAMKEFVAGLEKEP